MKLVHPDPQVGGLQQILHLLGVGIESRTVDVDVGREHTVDDRAQGTRHNLRIPCLANSLVQIPWSSFVDIRKGLFTVCREIPGHLPCLAPIVGLLDIHGGRPERLKGDDQVSDVELCFQVELDGHILHPVLGLPPGAVLVGKDFSGRLKTIDNVLNSVRCPWTATKSLRS